MSKLNVHGFVSGPSPPDAGPAPASRLAKDPRVESLRGLAILLMVAGHVIGSTSQAGMRVDDRSAYRYFYDTFTCLRLPLFSVLSGVVYSLSPASIGSLPAFLRRKSARILVPFAVVMPLQYLMRMAVPGVNFRPTLSGLPEAYLRGFDQFWFLQAIFLIFLAVSVLDALGGLRRFSGWLTSFAAAVAVSAFAAGWAPPVFSAPQAARLLPFFVLGCGIQRFPERLFHPVVLGVTAVLLALGVSAQQWTWFGDRPGDALALIVIPTLVGLSGNLLMARWFPVVRGLAFYGSYAYTIFLLHVFFTASSRMAVHRAGLGHPWLVFAVGLMAGINLPIVVERLLVGRPRLQQVLLGMPRCTEPPARSAADPAVVEDPAIRPADSAAPVAGGPGWEGAWNGAPGPEGPAGSTVAPAS